MYYENILEWIKIVNEYKILIFVLGVGLGGFIILNLFEKIELFIEGILLFLFMLELKRDYKGCKNKLIFNVGKIFKDIRFKVGIIF